MALVGAARDLRRAVAQAPPSLLDAVAAATLAAAALAAGAGPTSNDWKYYALGAEHLLGPDPLTLYDAQPLVQIGPLALAVAALVDAAPGSGETASVLLTAFTLVPVLHLARRCAGLLGKGITWNAYGVRWLVALAWFPLVTIGHIADAAVVCSLLLATLLLASDRTRGSGLALGLAIGAKPWAIAFAPLLFVAPRSAWRRALPVAGLVVAFLWLPFLLAAPGTIDAGQVQFLVPDDSWWRWVSTSESAPETWRIGQLLVLSVTAALVAWRARRSSASWIGWLLFGLALVSTLRVATDIGTWAYYVSAAAPMVATAERSLAADRPPWATWCLVLVSLIAGGSAAIDLEVAGVVRTALLAVAVCSIVISGARWSRAASPVPV